jgi:DNA-binding CsgD family transcriptional regulator
MVRERMTNSHPKRTGLLGRRSECEALDRLLAVVRSGQSQVLVVRGDAGSGKSALLEYLAEHASGCRVARAAGVESEMELPFAGIHQLCAPYLAGLERLPEPQREALSTAFGLGTGAPPDRFLVGLAALSLLADVAEQEPLVCLVDDAQWLDRVSAQTLTFVARRLLAEPLALVFAVREPNDEPAFTGLAELKVRGLGDGDARALLDSAIPGRLDHRVRDRIVAETKGNPLALLELPRGLTPAELAGGFGLPDVLPLATRIEQSFLRRLERLPFEARRLLLAAAAEPVGDPSLLWRAAERLGVDTDAAGSAEATGLIEFGARVRFRHPLVRSAVYRAASLPDRQAVHRALAEATDPVADPERRAWHRAHATAGSDEAVAGELERLADRARARGGVAAAAAFLERATELTPDLAHRGTRALAAAHAKFEAAAPDAADELLAAAELCPLDDLQVAQLERLRAQIAFARRRGSDAPPLLLDAAKRLEPVDAALARETYLEALAAAIFTGRLGNEDGMRKAARVARAAPPGPQPPPPLDLLLEGLATRYTDGYLSSVPSLRRAVDAFRQGLLSNHIDNMRLLWLASPIAQETAAHELMDDAAWHELATRTVGIARDTGALAVLPVALVYRARVHLHAGELAEASALIDEADAITAATGYAPVPYTSLVLAAMRGEEAKALEVIEAGVADATARGEGRLMGLIGYVTALLYNGLGRYDAALAGAERACEHEDRGFFGWSLAELVEAAVRSGAREQAVAALTKLEERTSAAGTDWALGIQARSRALMTDGTRADGLYREAIDRLGRTRMTLHLARAHLLYGEWLRREQRRLDAREHLRAAHERFQGMGAEAFAGRARRELQATGETIRARTAETRDRLTSQEAQIARLAADSYTNPQIGAQLFISPRTVEYHLRKVFTKLDISSRRELRAALPGVLQA